MFLSFLALTSCLLSPVASVIQVTTNETVPAKYVQQEFARICPLPTCGTCPSIDELRAPGIGFALETSHGSAVVRLHNGELHDIALIEGDSSYIDLMRQLATGPTGRTPDHIDNYWDGFQYTKSRAQRLLNKFLGRPATPQTAILSSMVAKLIEKTQMWLGTEHAIVSAVLSSPDRIGLTQEEIDDVFDYLKIRNLMTKPFSFYELYSLSAAYAGYGKGLCTTYTDAHECEVEEWKLSDQRVLHVDFNSESLSCSTKALRSAKEGSVDATFIDLGLGLRHESSWLGQTTGTDDDEHTEYWTAVSDRIRELVKSVKRVYLSRTTDLLLTGPSAMNPRFQAAVKAALQDLVATEAVLGILEYHNASAEDHERWQSTFSFATARGAAEIAKRRQEGPVGCTQSEECRLRRELVHRERGGVLVVQ